MIAIFAFLGWSVVLPFAAIWTGLAGRRDLLLKFIGVEIVLLIFFLLMPAISGKVWGWYENAPFLAVYVFIGATIFALAIHTVLAWIKGRVS